MYPLCDVAILTETFLSNKKKENDNNDGDGIEVELDETISMQIYWHKIQTKCVFLISRIRFLFTVNKILELELK